MPRVIKSPFSVIAVATLNGDFSLLLQGSSFVKASSACPEDTISLITAGSQRLGRRSFRSLLGLQASPPSTITHSTQPLALMI